MLAQLYPFPLMTTTTPFIHYTCLIYDRSECSMLLQRKSFTFSRRVTVYKMLSFKMSKVCFCFSSFLSICVYHQPILQKISSILLLLLLCNTKKATTFLPKYTCITHAYFKNAILYFYTIGKTCETYFPSFYTHNKRQKVRK